MSYYDVEIQADNFQLMEEALREDAIEQINWLFAEAQEDELPL